MYSGNKGEWSEIYVFLKLLSEGKLYAADENLNKIEDNFYPVLKVIRQDTRGEFEYVRDREIRVVDKINNNVVRESSDYEYAQQSKQLINQIKKHEGTFNVAEVESFLNSIGVTNLKAKSSDKSDIKVVVHDYITGHQPTLGFSIKSKLGSASTLLNAGKTTNFIFKIDSSLSDSQISAINNIDSRSKIKDRLKAIYDAGCNLSYYGMENSVFELNLQLIDSKLPDILGRMLVHYYGGEGILLNKLTAIIERENPCDFNTEYSHLFYKYKIQNFLTDIALGMTPSTVWNGKYDATGGYIIVKEDGEVVCYHIYNRNEFQQYLINNTRFDTASSSRHGFGTIYKENDDAYIKLNLQVRFN
ncbi:HpaII family restriction endonuclease [Paenibacillus lignilyticus]|uniref:HpaII family restriction endonuclease n=1 Tax=Paenibacillus lignilyticus TaxID=1172615 RepID=A0ABS5CK66_9BACL|nr:HpaII family restriction endonuclease [Paenibacillus lignilyticus]MBP3966248.1 HpaII family restriction endonuclease [Paenibacillus lignilyticus]